jgi:hypothetical protein
MAEQAPPLEFKDRESLEAWLRTQRKEATQIIAARAALRALPRFSRYARAKSLDQQRIAECAASIFRANAVAWVAGKYPARAHALVPAAYAATSAIDADSGVNVAAGAAYAAAIAVADADRAGAATRSLIMRADTDNILWACLADSSFLRSVEGSPSALAELPLWPTNRHPIRVDDSWIDLFDTLPQEQNWNVWLDWYRERLRGGPAPEEIDFVYVTVPQEKWDQGPAAANAWIEEQRRALEDNSERENTGATKPPAPLKIKDRESLEAWLLSQPPEVAALIAARAALRVLPLYSREALGLEDRRGFVRSAASLFRAIALARVMAKYSLYDEKFRILVSHAESRARAVAGLHYAAASAAAATANAATAAAAPSLLRAANYASAAAEAAADSAGAATYSPMERDTPTSAAAAKTAAASLWATIEVDAVYLQKAGASVRRLADRPLWPKIARPGWAARSLTSLYNALPADQNWEVWLIWYEARLEGRDVSDEAELVYARVPEEKWDEGPAVANAWIKAELERLNERVEEPSKRQSEGPVTPPAVPPKVPAAIEPIIRDGRIALPEIPLAAESSGASLKAALAALRSQIAELAGDLDGEANIDRRIIAYLHRLADRVPHSAPPQEQLFILAHEQEALEAYCKVVAQEWPELFAARFLSMTRAFERMVRQFPEWRAYAQIAERDRLSDFQRAATPVVAANFAASLRDEEERENVEPEVAEALDAMWRTLDATRTEFREDHLPSVANTMAEDIFASIGNILKLMAEIALDAATGTTRVASRAAKGYLSEMGEGVVDQAKKEGKKDGERLVKWVKRTLVLAGGAAVAKTAGLPSVIALLIAQYPQLSWLQPVIDFLKNLPI